MHIRELKSALEALETHGAATATQARLVRLNRGALELDCVIDELTQREDPLRNELALIQSVSVAPPPA